MATAHSHPGRRVGGIVLPDPLYPIWRWLTSVRVAIIPKKEKTVHLRPWCGIIAPSLAPLPWALVQPGTS